MTSRGTRYWDSGAIPLIAPDMLGNIISEVADIAVVIDEAGTILSVLTNPGHDAFAGFDHWEGRQIRDTLTKESVPKFDSRLQEFLTAQGASKSVELNHRDDTRQWEFPVRYSFHRIGADGAVLLLGRDLRPLAEMQQQLVNAQMALERDYEIQREFETRFRVVMDTVSDAIIFVSLQNGRITETNAAASALLNLEPAQLIRKDLGQIFETEETADLVQSLTAQALSDAAAPTKIKLRDGDQSILLSPTVFRVAGERVLLCRMTSQDGGRINSDLLAENLRGLFGNGSDGIVFTSQDGAILSANESFLNLISSADDLSARGKPLADFLQRGSVDYKVMTENASRLGRMRMYATKVAGEYGSPRSVEVAVTTISAGADTLFGFVIREVNRSDPVRQPSSEADQSMQSVVELVGSATLKEIVAETTNVVEKMCIETAVQLTMNNRVAAAEMLGLSRQSLYVKLRKFGIMDRDPES